MQNTMRIKTNETRKAFRVNGVTVAKRHLAKACGNGCGDDYEKMLFKYFVILPFLAEAFQMPEQASESVKYTATKAKRIHEALGINRENKLPFMLMAMEQSGLVPGPDGAKTMGEELRVNGFYGEAKPAQKVALDWRGNPIPFQQGERNNVIPFPGNQTKH